jgi:hypothetical protein
MLPNWRFGILAQCAQPGLQAHVHRVDELALQGAGGTRKGIDGEPAHDVCSKIDMTRRNGSLCRKFLRKLILKPLLAPSIWGETPNFGAEF